MKLLRALQEREFERVGSSKTIKANVRIIAATNQPLETRAAAGLFRQDLYYRINVFPIFLPPLRERRDDILLLADLFVTKYSRKMNKDVRRISTPAINMMFAYHWPGNVRELENCIEYAMLLTSDGVIHGHNLPPTLQLPEVSETARAGSLKIRVIMQAARSGSKGAFGDGKIFVTPVEEVYTISSGIREDEEDADVHAAAAAV